MRQLYWCFNSSDSVMINSDKNASTHYWPEQWQALVSAINVMKSLFVIYLQYWMRKFNKQWLQMQKRTLGEAASTCGIPLLWPTHKQRERISSTTLWHPDQTLAYFNYPPSCHSFAVLIIHNIISCLSNFYVHFPQNVAGWSGSCLPILVTKRIILFLTI